jgi:hypothetical protein
VGKSEEEEVELEEEDESEEAANKSTQAGFAEATRLFSATQDDGIADEEAEEAEEGSLFVWSWSG